ncbi:hypothetical protein AB0H76_09575 [Nocardia sp. NPDC050712]|uniref:hypothetical protein n=1 Tax=Nocardia sp. NPDC050712 TaxID=3155518 RepID=UPI0033FCF234
MVSPDIIAQLRQDITTAEDAGDQAAAQRLRADLNAALEETEGGSTTDLSGTGAAPQPADLPGSDPENLQN